MEKTEMTKTPRRLMTSCAALLLAAGLGGCAVYDDGYGPGYYNGGGGYSGGSAVVYSGGGYRPRYYRDHDRHVHRPAHYRHDDNDRGRWNGGGHRDTRWEGRRDGGRDGGRDGRHDHNRQAFGGN